MEGEPDLPGPPAAAKFFNPKQSRPITINPDSINLSRTFNTTSTGALRLLEAVRPPHLLIRSSPIYLPARLFSFATTEEASISSALPENPAAKASSSGVQINSNSVLVALLDSHYTELSELVEKLSCFRRSKKPSRSTISQSSRPEALERDLDPEFKRFLLEPGNLKSLQNLLLFRMIPARIESKHWPLEVNKRPAFHSSLCRDASDEKILLRAKNGNRIVSTARVIKSDDIVRPDGIIHGIERLLVPKSVQQDFNARRSLQAASAVIPEGAPEVDPRTYRLKKPAPPVAVGAPPVLPILDASLPTNPMAKRTRDNQNPKNPKR